MGFYQIRYVFKVTQCQSQGYAYLSRFSIQRFPGLCVEENEESTTYYG